MCCDNEELSGVMISMSRGAGTCVGTVTAAGKKVSGIFTGGFSAVGNLLTRPVEPLEEIEQKSSAKSLISSLESDLAAARGQLKETQSKAEQTQSQIATQLSELQSEKEALLAEVEQARSQANEVALQVSEAKTQAAVLEILETNLATAEQRNLEKPQPSFEMNLAQTGHEAKLPQPVEELVVGAGKEKSGSSTATAVADTAEQVGLKTKEQPPEAITKARMPNSNAVAVEQVQAAVFGKATDKILLAKAVSDIASGDLAVRMDAVKAMANIHHELSVKSIVAQAGSDTSAQVRQECIKALTSLKMTEGLPAIEKALTDQAGSVRLAAVWGLYSLSGSESTIPLLDMLSDEDKEVRRRTVTCIGWLGQKVFASRLIPLLNDSIISVRRAAVEAMGNLGNEQVVLSLIEQLESSDMAMKKIILSTIEKITGKKMVESSPKNDVDMDRLIARWREWWKEKLAE
ncbi:HEAT repeat domain-containing protein [Planctomycetota bacterium]